MLNIPDREVQHFYPRSPCGERHDTDWEIVNVPKISIHALLAESDCYFRCPRIPQQGFLSTLSLRRATNADIAAELYCSISIHALLAESDLNALAESKKSGYFYPRSPCGERRWMIANNLHISEISIHALLAESDKRGSRMGKISCDFYPRSPCGERLGHYNAGSLPPVFLSTLSLRRAT